MAAKKIFNSFIILFLSIAFYQQSSANPGLIQPGEELLYEVSFLGIKLGSIKIVTELNQEFNNKTVNKAKAFINSYRGIPFVSLQVIYQSWMDPSLSYSHKFVGNTKDGNSWIYEQIQYDYNNKKIVQERWKDKSRFLNKTIPTNGKWNDGLSLFFFARRYLNLNRSIKVPTFMDDTVYTSINFTGKRENVEISAVDYPIRTVYFKGIADWTGVYGLTGNFEGWFSDDVESVPIKASMKVYVGSVKIELISWKRDNWKPPKG